MKTNVSKTPLSDFDAQFEMLVNYGTIVKTHATIVQLDQKDYMFALYEVNEPYPKFDEYSKGEEFDEGKLINKFKTYEAAVIGQTEYVKIPVLA